VLKYLPFNIKIATMDKALSGRWTQMASTHIDQCFTK